MPRQLHIILVWAASRLAERGNKEMKHTDFCVLLCSVLVVAGEGTACFSAVSNAPAKSCLSMKLQRDKDRSERSGHKCPCSSYHSTSTTFTHTQKKKTAIQPVHIYEHTPSKSATSKHTQIERLWFEWYEWDHSTFPVTLNTEYFIEGFKHISTQNQVSLLQKTHVHQQGNYRKLIAFTLFLSQHNVKQKTCSLSLV